MADISGDIPTIADIKSHVISFASSNIKDERTSVDIKEYLNCLQPKFDILEEKKKAQGWLDWAKQLKTLKIVRSSVPIAILPNGYRGVLIDVKVNSPHAPDDKIYDANEKIRQRVARGNCFLQIENGPHNGTTCVLYALKKFTGGLGDDDDRDQGDNFTWKKYFTKPLESTERVVATRKANGEAAHLSCQIIDGHFVMCGGSKNVHLLFRRKEDIDRYKEPRYLIAREVCETVMHYLELMDQNDRFLLLSFLSHTHFTAVFEILSPVHQHVEDLSHLPRNELRFITWTEINIDSSNDGELCTVPPHVAIEIARALKLPTVDYDVIPMADLNNRMIEIRKGYNFEGEVLYFLDEKASVIGLLKKKTIWYILCRATREKVKYAASACLKSPEGFSISNAIRKLETRLDQIQSWLGLDNDGLKHWKELTSKFMRWTVKRVEDSKITHSDIADRFPVIWKEFLEESQSTDNIQFTWKEPEGSDD